MRTTRPRDRTPPPKAPAPRRYAGLSAAERRAARRGRLLDAALECYGTVGFRATTIPQLCSLAGVTARHFYEEFETQEALLRATYDGICAGLLDAVAPEMNARAPLGSRLAAACRAYFKYMTADPRRARVFAIEWIDAGVAYDRREQAIRDVFVRASRGRPASSIGAAETRLLAVSLVGAAKALTAEWVTTRPQPRVAMLERHLASLWGRALGVRL